MAVKIGASRQIIIPKKAYAALGLAAGDYLEVVVMADTLVMTPKTLVDKDKAPHGAGRKSDASKGKTKEEPNHLQSAEVAHRQGVEAQDQNDRHRQ